MVPWIGRVILIVLDGVGAGELPDAAVYGDEGSNTLGHVAQKADLQLPTLRSMGLGNIVPMRGVPPESSPIGSFGRMAEKSAGKDSTLGHWELTGVISPSPFPTYPDGFPPDIIARFEEMTGRGTIGNRPASGTQIIRELDREHRDTGKLIVYTSADSVFQVAAHKDVVPVKELHQACEAAGKWLLGEKLVLRVIARPYIGESGNLARVNRRDFNMPAPAPTLLDVLWERSVPVTTVGKIDSLFDGRGVTEAVRTTNNEETLEALRDQLQIGRVGLYFANLIDFDMTWGHRNDVEGFARGLEQFDAALSGIMSLMRDRDILFITADHGCDPTTPSTDHSREHVPVLAYGEHVLPGVDLGTRASFSDLAATVAAAFGVPRPLVGTSFWPDIAVNVETEVSRAYDRRVDWLRRRGVFGRSHG